MNHLPRPDNPDGFFLVSLIGKGSFAEVWLAKHNKSNTNVAIKVIPKNSIKTEDQKIRLFREIQLQKLFKHQYLASFYGMIENIDNYYLIMEFLPRGTLSTKIAQEGMLSESKARHYFIQTVYSMSYLHNQLKIAHRDLKAENIMLDLEDNIRIIDFGLSREIPKGDFKTKCGSPQYSAPEIYSEATYTESVDVWSAGIILYYMVTGFFPFDGITRSDMVKKILNNDVSFPPFLKDDLQDLLKKMLDKNPKTRITFQEILNHPWITRKNKEINPDLIDFYEDDSIFDRIKKRENKSKFGRSAFYSPLFKMPPITKTKAKKAKNSFLDDNEISHSSALSTPVNSPLPSPKSNDKFRKSKSASRFSTLNFNSNSSASSNLLSCTEQELKEMEIKHQNEQAIISRIDKNKRAMIKILSITSSPSNSKINF